MDREKIADKSSESLCRDDPAHIYLCAPWPLNDDGSVYGIDTFQFDSGTNDWRRRLVIDFSESNEKYGFGCACVGSKLFVLGGERCLELNGRLRFDKFDDVELYDIDTGSRKTLPSIPDGGRSLFWTISVGKYIYIFGGIINENMPTDECKRFDIERYSWQSLHPMPEEYFRPWAHNSVRELNGLIYVGCGPCLESLYVYDPNADTWMQLTSPRVTIDNPLMFKWKQVLYVTDNRLLHRYGPAENSWTSIKMNAGENDVFRDAIEVGDEIFTCTCTPANAFRFEFGKLKIDEECCKFERIESSIFSNRALLFLHRTKGGNV